MSNEEYTELYLNTYQLEEETADDFWEIWNDCRPPKPQENKDKV